MADMDGKELVIDCDKAEAQVVFEEPEDVGILARLARVEPASYVSFAMRPGICFVAEVEGKIVGAVWVRIMDDYGHVEDGVPSFAISLYKEYRRHGIGTVMMKQMLTELIPCKELHSYIRCYWGTENSLIQIENNDSPKLVIPDTCVDIIYHIDYINDTVTGGFCGINDYSFLANSSGTIGHMVSTFAIRFYAWSAYAFADDSLQLSAEIYGAAADRQQASIVFDVAKQMVEMSPALMKRSKLMTATKRIVNYGNAGYYQVLSAEAGGKHGLSVSGLVSMESICIIFTEKNPIFFIMPTFCEM